MLRKKKFIVTSLIVVAVLLLSVSIAYAALSSSLTITIPQVKQEVMTWDIGFNPGTVTCSIVTDNSGLTSCGSATVTTTTVSGIETIVSEPGDKCACTLSILNKGTIGGKISTINITKPQNTTCTISGSTMTCDNIIYKLHYDNAASSTLVAVGDTIAPKSGSTPTTKTVVLTIEHSSTAGPQQDVTQTGFAYNITYSQN